MAEPQGGGHGSHSTTNTSNRGKAKRVTGGSTEPTPVSPCGACKFLRRKCISGCIFAPHFGSDQGTARFAAVHKVFGASNVSKLLLHIPMNRRDDAVVTISYEAQARLSDPVYGCVSTILALQQQVASLQEELAMVQTQLINSKIVMANAALLDHQTSQQYQQQQQQQIGIMLQQPAYSNASSASNNNNNVINNMNNINSSFNSCSLDLVNAGTGGRDQISTTTTNAATPGCCCCSSSLQNFDHPPPNSHPPHQHMFSRPSQDNYNNNDNDEEQEEGEESLSRIPVAFANHMFHS
ncbi:hypothetical protein LguiA_013339 [Lonicera macranthoides]